MEDGKLNMDRLYDLYTTQIVRLHSDVACVNRSLGSKAPEKTWLRMLDRSAFESLIEAPSEEPAVIQRFIRRIVQGHEQDFPELRVA